MLNFRLILNENISLKETSGNALANFLSNKVNKLLPNGGEEELLNIFKSQLSTAYLGSNGLQDDFGRYFNNKETSQDKLYAAVAIRSYSYKNVIAFYKRHQKELANLNLAVVEQAIKLALQSKSLSYSQAEQQIRSKGQS